MILFLETSKELCVHIIDKKIFLAKEVNLTELLYLFIYYLLF